MPHQDSDLMAMPSEILNHILSYLFFIVGASQILFYDNDGGDDSLRDLPVHVLRVSRIIHVQATEHLKKALRSTHLHFVGCLPSHETQARSLLRTYSECFESVTIREYEAPHMPARGLRVLLDYNLGLLKGLNTLTLAEHGHYSGSTLIYRYHTWQQWADGSCESANKAIVKELSHKLNSDNDDEWPFRAWRNLILAGDGERRFRILLVVEYKLEDPSQGSDNLLDVWINYTEQKVLEKQTRLSVDWCEVQ